MSKRKLEVTIDTPKTLQINEGAALWYNLKDFWIKKDSNCFDWYFLVRTTTEFHLIDGHSHYIKDVITAKTKEECLRKLLSLGYKVFIEIKE